MSAGLDLAFFPHVLDGIVDELYHAHDVEALLALRATSSSARETVDRKLRSHLVVRGKAHDMTVATRWGRLPLNPYEDCRRHGSRALEEQRGHRSTRRPKVCTVDVHHFNFHPVCNFNAKRLNFESCEAEDAIASYVRSASPEVVRLFDSRGFSSDACGASTVVFFTEAYYHFSTGVKVKLVPGVENVVNIRYGPNVGLFEVLWGDEDVCLECLQPPSPTAATFFAAPPAPTIDTRSSDVTLIFTPFSPDSSVQDPPHNPDQKRGLLNSLIVSAIAHLHRHPGARVTLVGAEQWSPSWFQTWSFDPSPPSAEPGSDDTETADAQLTSAEQVRHFFDAAFLHYARAGWSCAPHYAQKVKCTALSEDEIRDLRGRVDFVTDAIFRSRVGREIFALYTVE